MPLKISVSKKELCNVFKFSFDTGGRWLKVSQLSLDWNWDSLGCCGEPRGLRSESSSAGTLGIGYWEGRCVLALSKVCVRCGDEKERH